MKYLLFLDYDGTLTPIVKKPRLAVLSKAHRAALRKISKSRNLIVIISGRMLSDLKRRVGLSSLYYAGNHGFEIEGPKIKITHPKALLAKPILRKIKAKLKKSLKDIPGVIVEDKILTLSLHYRMVSTKDFPRIKQIFTHIVKPFVKTRKIRVTLGKKVFEIRPNIPWDKGRAVLWFLKKLGRRAKFIPIYIGDDRTDEDAFRALRKKGITIRVGRKRKSAAQYYVRDVTRVYRFLQSLQKINL